MVEQMYYDDPARGPSKEDGLVVSATSSLAVPHHRGRSLSLPRPFDVPDQADLAAVRRWVASAPKPTAIDLFSGCGGLSLGLQDAGFSVLVGADNDPAAVESHSANLRSLGHVGDLSDPTEFLGHLQAWGITTVDLLTGGVPCQPFSRAGRSKLRSLVSTGARSADDARAHLWDSFLQIVEALQPRAVLLENVPELAAWSDGAVLVGFREGLRELGYRTDARVLKAQTFGVPQHRERLFIVALYDCGAFAWPEPSDRYTLRDAIGDLPPVAGGQRDDTIPYTGAPLGELGIRMRRGVATDEAGVIHDHITRAVRADDAEAFNLLSPGGTYEDLPKRLRRYRSDIFTDKYKRLEWDGLSRSITAHLAKDGYWYIHPEQPRTLSIREAARIQTFPDWFRFAGHPSARYRQIGNAVPPLLGEAVARSVRQALDAQLPEEQSRNEAPRFRTQLLSWHASNARSFPWRAGAEPWHVLMAEMCLHRTRADQVVPVYRELVKVAPTPARAATDPDAALTAMRSLGLRWRADNVVQVAKELVERYNGEVPDNENDLATLPGVGDYVANAVLCFAFGRRAILLDTNTERIVQRIRGAERSRRSQMRLDLYELAGREGANSEFNYGLLDLGALVCRAAKPRCNECPVVGMCVTASFGATPPPMQTSFAPEMQPA